MTTPTDDEIVARMRAMGLVTGDATKAAAYAALHLAREGLPVPVKDDARELLNALFSVDGRWKGFDASLATIRTFLATRDAERDAERDEMVAELVAAATYTRNWLKNSGYHNEWTKNLSAALAKLELKP